MTSTPDAADAPEVADAPGTAGEPTRVLRAVLVGLVVLPILVAVVRALRHDWFPIGDDALLYIRVRDVLTSHHPLLGSWSSASLSLGTNINNPGPLYQDLAAPFAHLLGPGAGAAIGVGVLNSLAIVGASSAARHVSGWSLQRWILLACAALSWTMGSELLFDIWQAHALLLPFLCFLVLLVGVATCRTRCIPWALFVGSLLVQTHISYAYILGTLTPVAIALAWWNERVAGRNVTRQRIVRGLRGRTARISYAVLAVVWIQTVVEQLFGEGQGNLSRLVSNSGGGDVTLGFANAVKIVAAIVALPPWWLRRGFSSTVPSTRLTDGPDGPELRIASLPNGLIAVLAVLVLVAALALAARWCARAGLRVQAHAAALAAAGVLAAVLCLGLLTVGRVGLAAHHVRWVWPFAVVVQTVLGWALASLALRRWGGSVASGRSERIVTVATVAVSVAFAALTLPFHAQQEGPVSDVEAMPALRTVFHALGEPTLLDRLESVQPIVYETANLRVFEPYSSAVMMRLQELGIEFRVTDEGMVRQLGNGRRADGTESATLVQLEGSDALLHDGPECLLALGDALDDGEAAAATTAADVLAAGLVDGTVFIDTAVLPDDERAQYDVAFGGDVDTARRLVYEGYVQRWLLGGAGYVDTPGIDALEATLAGVPDRVVPTDEANGSRIASVTLGALDLIEDWVVSSYALVGTGALCAAG